MNFRLFRTSLFLTLLFLLRFGLIQAEGFLAPQINRGFAEQSSHPVQHDVVSLPIEITEDNEVNEARKRLVSFAQAVIIHFELYYSLTVESVTYNDCSSIPLTDNPRWLKNCVFRI
jgi:hypothetical protein